MRQGYGGIFKSQDSLRNSKPDGAFLLLIILTSVLFGHAADTTLCPIFATTKLMAHFQRRRSIPPQCLASLECSASKAQYCSFRRFNCPRDTRRQSAVESTVVPSAVTSRHDIWAREFHLQTRLSSLDSRHTWPGRVALVLCYPLSGSLIGPDTPL